MRVAVLGSVNMDVVAYASRFPAAGETLTGEHALLTPGGKGANQAVAVARLGPEPFFIGRVGGDIFGKKLLDSLRDNHVDVSNVRIDSNVNSGMASILITGQGENSIVIVPGANGAVGRTELECMESLPTDVGILLLQLEVPVDVVLKAAEIGQNHNMTVILDPAPAASLPKEIYSKIDIITPNQSEAEQLVGFPVKSREDAEKAANELLQRGVSEVVIKMGALGIYWKNNRSSEYFPAYETDVVDTVAAGDAFNGALAVGLVQGQSMQLALRWGLGAGALCVSRQGAQQAMPTPSELKDFLLKNES